MFIVPYAETQRVRDQADSDSRHGLLRLAFLSEDPRRLQMDSSLGFTALRPSEVGPGVHRGPQRR